MVKTDADRTVAVERLRYFKSKFDVLLELLGEGKPLRGAKKDQARDLLRDLKDSLDAELKQLDRREASWTHIERAFLEPALRKSRANILSRVNTIPDDKWHSDLYGARIDITHMLYQLEGQDD